VDAFTNIVLTLTGHAGEAPLAVSGTGVVA
jgi:hypothetical protein